MTVTNLLFYSFGQSNEIGLGVAANMPGGVATLYPAVTYVEKTSRNLDPPVFVVDGPRGLSPRTISIADQPAGTAGSELAWGRKLDAAYPGKIFIVKFAVDSSGLENYWLPTSNYPVGAGFGNRLFDMLVADIKASQTLFSAKIAGFKVNNGGTDANEVPDAVNFGPNWATMINALRAIFGPVPFVFPRLHIGSNVNNVTAVRSGQTTVSTTVPRTAMINVDDQTFRDAGNIHWSDTAYKIAGDREGDALVALLADAPPMDITIGVGSGDVTPPTVTIVSPTPGIAPGNPGGFSANWEVARFTPVVVDIADVAPGNLYQCLTLTYTGSVAEVTVFRRGAFRGDFVGGQSSAVVIGSTLRLTFRPVKGWPNTSGLVSFTLNLDAVDAVGNLAP